MNQKRNSELTRNALFVLSASTAGLAVVAFIATRTAINDGSWIGTTLVWLGPSYFLVRDFWMRGRPFTSVPIFSLVVVSLLMVGLAVSAATMLGLNVAARNHLVPLVRQIMSLNGKGWTLAAAAPVTILLGVAFFVFRLKHRFLYGATEAFAGAAVAVHRVSTEPGTGLPDETGFYVAILTAGIGPACSSQNPRVRIPVRIPCETTANERRFRTV
jgi:hypothetical protein